MDYLYGRSALVTGAARGIGCEIARALAQVGMDLYLCDVAEEPLEALAAELRLYDRQVHAAVVDVGDRERVRSYADEVHARTDALDVLVNNAGVSLFGGFLDTSVEDWDWLTRVNWWGVIHCCHFFIPPMVRRAQGGHVVNVASMAGFLANAQQAAYSATKFGVFGLSEALRMELLPHGIRVTTVCPGIVATHATQRARLRGTAARPGERDKLIHFAQKRNYQPERVAAQVVSAIRGDGGVLPISPEAKFFYWLKRLAPDGASALLRKLAEQ